MGTSEAVPQEKNDHQDSKGDHSGDAFRSSHWNSISYREGVMDIVEFTNWLVPRMIAAGGVLLMVMAVAGVAGGAL